MALYAEAMAMLDDAQEAGMDTSESTVGMMTHEQQQQAAEGHDQQRAPPLQKQASTKDPMVRELTAAEVASFTSLQQVADWAKFKGDVTWSASKPGSLLSLFTDEEDMADLEISEFASIPSKQLEKLLEQWAATY